MRKEVSLLWEQALEDIDTAKKLIEVEKYYAAVFFAEQAAEKALKALVHFIRRFQRNTFLRESDFFPERSPD